MNSFHARRTPPAVAALLLGLLAATPAHATALADQPNAPWGLDRIDQRTGTDGRYHYGTTAANVRVYVVGTGVSPVPDLLNRLLPGYATGGGSTADDNGNGTFLAGVAAGTTHGVAKQAKVVPVKVLDASGAGTVSGVVAGLDWIRANAVKPAVALLSIGGGPSAPVDDAVRRLIASGVTVSAASGSSNANAVNFSPRG
ncbi:S8 family serine peptidase [Actinokineospora sp. G85]|uniref:S8 family serine peptidase n=1 Tax=Actinokineospora sp. G85 TaxID=3406626 RepID=UPI003C7969EB